MRPALETTRVVVECTDCGFRREYPGRSRRVSGAAAGHAKKVSCSTDVEIREEAVLVCESCGYADGEEGAVVADTTADDQYQEPTLCQVCRAHRDERLADAIDTVLGPTDHQPGLESTPAP